MDGNSSKILVIGAGPAGLTAAYQLVRAGDSPVVLEADDVVGGIARTVLKDDWRFDIGGHRFFTKVSSVEKLWFEILPIEDWLVRPRTSHILYNGKMFDYPLKIVNALRGLGLIEAVRCVFSYLWAHIVPPKDQTNFEGWVSARFGRRLYGIFFETYTEKVWGVPPRKIQADWAAQRIKSLSLWSAIRDALRLGPRKSNSDITSLISEFHYPRLGPGMLWERCCALIEEGGGEVRLKSTVVGIDWTPSVGARRVRVRNEGGSDEHVNCTSVISSMPLSEIVDIVDPPPPANVLSAGRSLKYRDFLVVALVLPESTGFAAQWIYVHTPGVRVGRIQNFAQWSPDMVKPGTACLGLEYFVNEGDEMWLMDDSELLTLASRELEQIGLASSKSVEAGYVVRMRRAYPTYDDSYAQNVQIVRTWLENNVPNIHPVGRNGMHRYNNQDHSMLTAMLTVENITAHTDHDVWTVNVEEDYHEGDIQKSPSTGRDAPILPSDR